MNLVDKFLLFEDEHALFSEKINGFSFWQYIRFKVFYMIVSNHDNYLDIYKSISNERLISVFLLYIKNLKYYFTKSSNWNLDKKDILVINHPRRVKNGDYFDCIYSDPFLSQTHHSYSVFELPYKRSHFEPTRTKNLRYLDRAVLFTTFYKRVMRINSGNTFNSNEIQKVNDILHIINNEFNIIIPKDEFFRLVETEILTHKAYLRYFERVLEKVKPKLIIEVVSYMHPKFALNQLAKSKGIPTIEIQHGTMGKCHIAYNFPKDVELDSFPDYIFTFGQFWKDNTRLPIDPSRVRVVGWPYFEKKVESYKNSAILDERKMILFISQPTIGKALSKLAVELNNLLDHKKFNIIYKLHPSELSIWKERYPWLLVEGIDVADKVLRDVHYYLSKAFVQVGVASTALFEGIGYGLNTAIFKAPSYEYMEELYQNGMANLVEDENQLLSYINSCENRKLFNTEYFWKSNSMKNFNENINNIISKG